MTDVAAAYAQFARELRDSSFDQPKEGWPAELIAAHLARNNELIAEAAEQVAAGGAPKYDNAAAVDEAALRTFVSRAGGKEGLAEAVEATAERLGRARTALDQSHENYPLPVVIRDSGELVRDGAIPIARFIEGNATFHLKMHLAQLRALAQTPSEVSDRLA